MLERQTLEGPLKSYKWSFYFIAEETDFQSVHMVLVRELFAQGIIT